MHFWNENFVLKCRSSIWCHFFLLHLRKRKRKKMHILVCLSHCIWKSSSGVIEIDWIGKTRSKKKDEKNKRTKSMIRKNCISYRHGNKERMKKKRSESSNKNNNIKGATTLKCKLTFTIVAGVAIFSSIFFPSISLSLPFFCSFSFFLLSHHRCLRWNFICLLWFP